VRRVNTTIAALSVLLILTGCGKSKTQDALCALGELPARTPAEIQVLQQRADEAWHRLKPMPAPPSARQARILRAVLSVQQSAQTAQFAAGASASGLASLASDLFSGLGTASGYIVGDLPKAQAELRAACSD
jgi:hypothetical protein